MKKIPIIIDCDPGVDDSYAIALANSHPEFELVALTAVVGNMPASVTRRNCLGLRDTFALTQTKVAYGAELPLVKPYFRSVSVTHGEGGVGGIHFPEPTIGPEEKPAWDLIYDEAVKHKGELLLFAIGPLTNIALALRKHPDLPNYLKKFIIMGGGTFGNVSSTDAKAEFNMWVDPTAAKEVFAQMEVYMVGLNATHASALSRADFDQLLSITAAGKNPPSHFLHQLSLFSQENSFGRGEDNNVIHDALAIASQIDPSIVSFRQARVFVEDSAAASNIGETLIDFESTEPNCWVAAEVDQRKFVRLLQAMCSHYSQP